MRPRDYVLFLSDLTGLAGFLVTLRSIDILEQAQTCMWVPKEGKYIRTFGCYFWPLGSQQSFSVVTCKGPYVYYVPSVGRGFWRGVQFSKRLDFGGQFWKGTKREGVEILRQRAGLLSKSCQTTGSLSTTKFYPYKAWPRNLSAKSTTRNVAWM